MARAILPPRLAIFAKRRAGKESHPRRNAAGDE
jgi:hypothetical protein